MGLNSIMVVYVDPLRVYKGLHSLDLKGELLTCELRGLTPSAFAFLLHSFPGPSCHASEKGSRCGLQRCHSHLEFRI